MPVREENSFTEDEEEDDGEILHAISARVMEIKKGYMLTQERSSPNEVVEETSHKVD